MINWRPRITAELVIGGTARWLLAAFASDFGLDFVVSSPPLGRPASCGGTASFVEDVSEHVVGDIGHTDLHRRPADVSCPVSKIACAIDPQCYSLKSTLKSAKSRFRQSSQGGSRRRDTMVQCKLRNRRTWLQTTFDQTCLRQSIKAPPPVPTHELHTKFLILVGHNMVSTSFLVHTSCLTSFNAKRCRKTRAYSESDNGAFSSYQRKHSIEARFPAKI